MKQLSDYLYYEENNPDLKIYCGDCLEIMPLLPKVALVMTDPPYNASNSNIGFDDKQYKTVDEEWDKGFTVDYIDHCKKVLDETGSILTFCSYHLLPETMIKIREVMKLQQVLHWIKDNPFPAIAKVYTPNVEYICWGVNGSPYEFNKKESGHNILKSPILNGHERTEHPTQKPMVIIKRLINVHSAEEDLVLDPFLGSGTTLVACKELNRNGIGIEINPKYCEIAKKRLINTQRMML